MSTPTIWIFLPIAVSILLMAVHRLHKLSVWIAALSSLLFAAAAFIFPQDLDFSMFGRHFHFDSTFMILNRSLILSASQLRFVSLLYFFSFLWNLTGLQFSTSRWFPTISLAITALWVSALAVEPFLYAAAIVELIVLISTLLITPRGEPASSGVLRYLVTQTIALPFILLSGWMVAGIESAPIASTLVLRGTILICSASRFGWQFSPSTLLTNARRKSHPLVFSFFFLMRQSSLWVFYAKFPTSSLAAEPGGLPALQWIGVLLCWLEDPGIHAIQYQRILAYLVMTETGCALLGIGLIAQGGGAFLALSFLPRALAYWQWSYTLSSIQKIAPEVDGSFDSLRGLFRRLPFHSASLILSMLSLLGLPAFGIFPAKRMLWNIGAGLTLPYTPLLSLAVAGMSLFILRLLRALVTPEPNTPSSSLLIQREEPAWQIILLCALTLFSLLMGIFPHLFLNPFMETLGAFSELMPPN